MKKARLIALLVAVLLVSTSFYACGSNTDIKQVRQEGVTAIQTYRDDTLSQSDFTTANKTAIENIAAAAIAEIDNARDEDEVDTIVAGAISGISAIPGSPRYTYFTYNTVTPSNWNYHSYMDNNDTAIMNYIGNSFYEFDYKFDGDGEIVPGEFSIRNVVASGIPTDVSAEYVGSEWGIAAGATGRAWKIPLRNDLKWDDGTPIDAGDFVYSMAEQLNPLFKHQRADSYYNADVVIHNAKSYVYQGSTALATVAEYMAFSGIAAEIGNIDDLLALHGGLTAYVNWDYSFGAIWNGTEWVEEGFEDETVETDFTLSEMYDIFLSMAPIWGVPASVMEGFFLDEASANYTYPAVTVDQLGIKATANNELILILDKSLQWGFDFPYNLGGTWLVKEDLYEANKHAPVSGSSLWTSTYGTSVASTASFGPYKLVAYQSGKEYILQKNEHWFGNNMPEFDDEYQSTYINGQTVADWQAAWMLFQTGKLTSIGIDVTIASDYKGSDQAYFTPTDYVGSLQLQSSATALKGRETAGIDKEMLLYQDFRQALSLAIDRAAYATQVTTSHLAGHGLFNSMHYYDVENGAAYRSTDIAKDVLCEVYGVEYGAGKPYATLEEAYDAITGYDLTQARALLTAAYEEALQAGTISATDKVQLVYGTSSDNEQRRRPYNFLSSAFTALAVGTPLAGRIELVFDGTYDTGWADQFKAGAYDICAGGWTGAAWDPFYFMLAYLGDKYRYAQGWKPGETSLEITIPGEGEGGADLTLEMTLPEWYDAVNGDPDSEYNFGAGSLSMDKRLIILGEMEKAVLLTYYTVPITYEFQANLRSFQVRFPTEEYNTFMAWGGIQYLNYNYTDKEWAAFVKSQPNGIIDYK